MKHDLMLIEFASDGTSWTIIQRSKHHSVSRIFLREKPQSVRFMIIVSDPCNVSTREVIKVSREVTEVKTSDMFGASTSAKTSSIDKAVGKTHDDRVKVDEVDKTDAVIVESKDDRIDTVAKGVESQDDNVAKSGRDETSRAKIDEVVEKVDGEVPRVCDSRADVEQAMEAPHSSISRSAPQQSTYQKTTLHRVLSNELLSKLSTCQMRRSQYNGWTGNHST